MIMVKKIIIAIFFWCALVVGGCDRNYDGEAADLPLYEQQVSDSEAADIPTEWESFKRETEMQIDENMAKLRELRNTANARHTDKIAELEEKNELMRRELREYTYDTEERWAKFRDGFDKSMSDLGIEIDGVYTNKSR